MLDIYTGEGIALTAALPLVLDAMFSENVWAFTIRREVLSYGEYRCEDGQWAYQLPLDCVSIATSCGRMEGGVFVTRTSPPLHLRYVARVTDASAWDPLFCDVLAWRLALEIQPELMPVFAPALLEAGLRKAMRMARRSGAIETEKMAVESTKWTGARL